MAFWYFKYARAVARKFRVTLYDLRGHGHSEMPPTGYSPAVQAQDLAGLMDHLRIEKAHFLAHSFGGLVTLNFACAQPQRVSSLVLADINFLARRHVQTRRQWAYGLRFQPILDHHGLGLDTRDPYFGYKLLKRAAQWQLSGYEVPAEVVELVSPLLGKTGKRTSADWLKLLDTTSAEAEMMGDDGLALERLRALRFPILALYGDHSHARLTEAEVLTVWRHAVFRRVPDAGHFFPSTRHEETLSECNRFWGGGHTKAPLQQDASEGAASFLPAVKA
jgi:pimeloyl-ACP methyl ester carboxylesterase